MITTAVLHIKYIGAFWNMKKMKNSFISILKEKSTSLINNLTIETTMMLEIATPSIRRVRTLTRRGLFRKNSINDLKKKSLL